MAARGVRTKQSALAKARERRRELDKTRDEQDQRIEEATAVALVALEGRDEAERVLAAATDRVGAALRLLFAEDVSAERAAALLEVDVTEIRRLVKAAPAEPRPASAPRSRWSPGRHAPGRTQRSPDAVTVGGHRRGSRRGGDRAPLRVGAGTRCGRPRAGADPWTRLRQSSWPAHRSRSCCGLQRVAQPASVGDAAPHDPVGRCASSCGRGGSRAERDGLRRDPSAVRLAAAMTDGLHVDAARFPLWGAPAVSGDVVEQLRVTDRPVGAQYLGAVLAAAACPAMVGISTRSYPA